MEDKVISITPAMFQLTLMTWLSIQDFLRYLDAHHPVDLAFSMISVLVLPFLAFRVRTAWRQRAFSDL
jgi:hypothetical protein